MCEFCMQHGEGKKWYLDAKNYGEDLLSDAKLRKLQHLFGNHPPSGEGIHEQMDKLDQAPGFIRRLMRGKIVRNMKKLHYGQIVPIEDVERIFEFVNSIVRTSCICRYLTLKEEKRYCYGISLNPNSEKLSSIFQGVEGFSSGPDPKGTEVVSKEAALASFREHEKEGLCHSVWTFATPFIGGICNCDRPDCLAMQMTVVHNTPTMFRAEYVAETKATECNGCRQCMRVCQFGAIGYSASQKKADIDPRKCYGCGICRSVCKQDAIILKDRAQAPAAANIW
jgi:ferredoxin